MTEVLQELTAMREQLTRIAAALEILTAPPKADKPGGCTHPADQREDFGVTDGVEDWLCRACGYRTVVNGACV